MFPAYSWAVLAAGVWRELSGGGLGLCQSGFRIFSAGLCTSVTVGWIQGLWLAEAGVWIHAYGKGRLCHVRKNPEGPSTQ